MQIELAYDVRILGPHQLAICLVTKSCSRTITSGQMSLISSNNELLLSRCIPQLCSQLVNPLIEAGSSNE